jgi:MFS family permease
LRIATSYDLGPLGPGESEPIFYHWHWYYSAPGLALWAILALALVGPRANRTRAALPILVPVLLANLVWLVVARIAQPVTSDRETLGVMVLSLTVASAVLWLLGHRIARYTQYTRLVLAVGIALGVALAGAFSITDFSRITFALPSLLSVLTPALVLGYAGAGWMSQRTYRPTRFILLLAAWTVALSAVGIPLWFLWGSTATTHSPIPVLPELGVFLLAGAIAGACVFLISVPFVLVGLRSPLFRPRLFACLRLPVTPDPSAPATAAPARPEDST